MKQKNYNRYFAIATELQNLGVHVERADLIHTFTDGKKTSLTELYAIEYEDFCDWIELRYNLLIDRQRKQVASYRMRRKIIAKLIRVGFEKDGKPDMAKIYAWVKKYGYLKKDFNSYKYKELPKLVTQAELFYEDHLSRVKS